MFAHFLWQILDVNNQSFEKISHSRALDILRGSTHLSITVKTNVIGKLIVVTCERGKRRGDREKERGGVSEKEGGRQADRQTETQLLSFNNLF